MKTITTIEELQEIINKKSESCYYLALRGASQHD